MAMHNSGGTKSRGRTKGAANAGTKKSPTRPNTQTEMRSEANRPVSSGTKHRGDRRDTNPKYTGNAQQRPNLVDPLGSGKKQIQGGGKALKNAGAKRK